MNTHVERERGREGEREPGALGRSRRISSVETMVRRLPTSSRTASPNLGQDRRSTARLLSWALASFRTRVVVVILTLFPSSSNLYSITFLTPFSSGPIIWRGGSRKSKSSPSSSSSSPHRTLLGWVVGFRPGAETNLSSAMGCGCERVSYGGFGDEGLRENAKEMRRTEKH
jgi:hypothetical protein